MNNSTFSIRIPNDMKERLLDLAKSNDRTLNGEVNAILKAALRPVQTAPKQSTPTSRQKPAHA
jgi:predicted DNA-binding protein